MSAATATKRKAKTVAFAAPDPVSVTAARPATPHADHPQRDAALIQACAEYPAVTDAYNRRPEADGDEGPTWEAYQRVCEAICDGVPMTLEGMLAKAKAAKFDALCPDGTERPDGAMASTWAWQLVNDLLRLGGSIKLPAAAPPAADSTPDPDAVLIAEHLAFDTLERRWLQMFEEFPDGAYEEREAAQEPLVAAQACLVNRMAKTRATTMAGLAARVRTVLLENRDLRPGLRADDPGEFRNRRLMDMLFRDVCLLTGVTPENALEPAPDPAPIHEKQSMFASMAEQLLHADRTYEAAGNWSVANKDAPWLLKKHHDDLESLMAKRSYAILDHLHLFRAHSVDDAALVLAGAINTAQDLDANDYGDAERNKKFKALIGALYSVAYPIRALIRNAAIAKVLEHYAPARLDPHEEGTDAVEEVLREVGA
jgi:hypothetical protein